MFRYLVMFILGVVVLASLTEAHPHGWGRRGGRDQKYVGKLCSDTGPEVGEGRQCKGDQVCETQERSIVLNGTRGTGRFCVPVSGEPTCATTTTPTPDESRERYQKLPCLQLTADGQALSTPNPLSTPSPSPCGQGRFCDKGPVLKCVDGELRQVTYCGCYRGNRNRNNGEGDEDFPAFGGPNGDEGRLPPNIDFEDFPFGFPPFGHRNGDEGRLPPNIDFGDFPFGDWFGGRGGGQPGSQGVDVLSGGNAGDQENDDPRRENEGRGNGDRRDRGQGNGGQGNGRRRSGRGRNRGGGN